MSSCCTPNQESNTNHADHDEHRQQVRSAYAKVANSNDQGECCGIESSCCGVSDDDEINMLISTRLGYSKDDLDNVPSGADMGLGCGNPRAIASLQPGETVVDLGEGLTIAPSTLSHHLKELHRAGLIQMQRNGKHVECWVEPQVLERLSAFFNPNPKGDHHE